MKLIKLHGKWGEGKFTMVDDWWFDELNKFKWNATEDGYVERKENGKHIFMHRFVNKTPKGKLTDHKNQNRFDNQESNLRTATHSTNGVNKPKPFGEGIYKGVTKVGNFYRAQIWNENKRYSLGMFPNERWAGMAYHLAALDLFDDFTCTTFSDVQVGS